MNLFQRMRLFLIQAVTENLGLKLVAFLIALLLFVLVRFQEESERPFDVEIDPILPEASDGGYQLTSDLPRKVRLRLVGPSSIIKSLRSEDMLPVKIDLRNSKPGISYHYFKEETFENSFKEQAELRSGLQFVRIARITPESVLIKMEKLISRIVPVRVVTVGNLKRGTELVSNPKAIPSSVEVVGPASAMRDLKYVETEDVITDDLGVGDHEQLITLRAREGVTIDQGAGIKVRLQVRWTPGKRLISGLLVQAQGTELAASFKPNEVAVSLAGPQIALDSIDLAKIQPVVVITPEQSERPGVYRGDVTVKWLPENVKVTSIVPAKVRVSLTHITPRPKKAESDAED